ncbi:MAG: multidrug effflux MFS transporter [Emcibacteraceae bacterium]
MAKRVNLLNRNEFICIMAMLMSITALSVDSMIPALGQMTKDLNVINANDIQLVISAIFFGIAFGVVIYGPFADSYGRKKAIYVGVSIFLLGTLIAIFSTSLNMMLLGRVIQGFGSASCRVVSLAIIRDKYEGREMAKIMSLIIMVFIMVPALAPLIGQTILLFAGWQAIFWFIFFFAVAGVTWMHFRQRETLAIENVRSFSFKPILYGMIETVKHPISLGYTFASGTMFGAFVSYLSSAQQIMQVQYNLGELFPIYFGILAIAYGISSYINSKLVARFTIEQVCFFFLVLQSSLSLTFLIVSIFSGGNLTFELFYFYQMANFFCLGCLFGNFSSMALQPFGHMAGLATSVITSIQTLLAVLVGGSIARLYDGTVQPMIAGFFLCGAVTLFIFLKLRNQSLKQKSE